MSKVEFSDGSTSVRVRVGGDVYDYGKLITVPRSEEKLQMIADAFDCTIKHGDKLLAQPRP